MKKIHRFRTLRAYGVLLLLCTIVLALPGCHAASPTATSPAANAKASPAFTLDVVLLGPFALLDCPGKETIRVLVPNVPDHKPLQIGYPSTIHHDLAAGDYQLLGPPGSKAEATFANPVEETGALTFLTKDVCPKTPDPCEHVCIDMPRPEQFVPWNADPAQVFIPGKDQPSWPRLATALVLRYPVSDFKGMRISQKDDKKPCGPKMPCGLTPEPNASEGVLALVLEPNNAEDPTHSHAKAAFHRLMGLIHMTGRVEFPDTAEGPKRERNKPRIDGVVPEELIVSLGLLEKAQILNGPHNDCVSMLVVGTDSKQKK